MKILVISDQPLTSCALHSLLRHSHPMAAVHDVARFSDAMRRLQGNLVFDFIVLDIDTHGTGRMHGAALLRRLWPDVALVIMSAVRNDDEVARAMDVGAMAYLPKTANMETLTKAFRQVIAGNIYMPELNKADEFHIDPQGGGAPGAGSSNNSQPRLQ